jgi:transcription elongation factor Elf1
MEVKQRWDACIDCGVEKKTRKQRGSARCRPCGIRLAYRDPELRARVAEHSRKMWEDPERREKVSTAMKAALENPELRERRSRAQSIAKSKPESRAKQSLAMGGDGDLERIDRAKRRRQEYSSRSIGRWAESVRKRDGHRCRRCGTNREMLHAHHIKPRAMYPELTLDLENGVTLCKSCHVDEHRRMREGTSELPLPPT